MKNSRGLVLTTMIFGFASIGVMAQDKYYEHGKGGNFKAPTVNDCSDVAGPEVGEIIFDYNGNTFYGRNKNNDGWINLGSGTNAGTLITTKTDQDYTITDTDEVRTLLMDTGSSNRTVTLPTVGDNEERIIAIKKIDSDSGKVIIDGENSEEIDGALTQDLFSENDVVTLQSDGSEWRILDLRKARRYLEHLLESDEDQTSDGTISALTQTLESGKTYRISVQAAINVKNGSASVFVKDGSTVIGWLKFEEKNSSGGQAYTTLNGTFIYQMQGTSLTLYASSIGEDERVDGTGDKTGTFITVEELDNYKKVTSF